MNGFASRNACNTLKTKTNILLRSMQSTPPYIFATFSEKGTKILYFAMINERICITQCVQHLKSRTIILLRSMKSTLQYIFTLFSEKSTKILYFAVINDRICITQCVQHPLKLRQIFFSEASKVHPRTFSPFSRNRARKTNKELDFCTKNEKKAVFR